MKKNFALSNIKTIVMMQNRKTVLITGANQGLGFATAKQLIDLGYFVYLGSRSSEKGIKASEELKRIGLEAFEILQIDVTDAASVKAAVEKVEQSTPHLDILINNAGISGPSEVVSEGKETVVQQHFSKLSIEDIREVFDVNFFGAIQVAQAFLPLLKKSSAPKILNISSGLGSLTNHTDPEAPFYEFFQNIKYAAYNSSKTALNAFTVFLADELKSRNIKVNSISPGFASTNLTSFQGPLQPQEAIQAIIGYVEMEVSPTGGFYDENGAIAW